MWYQLPTRTEPVPPRVEARCLYHWTARELPFSGFEMGGSSRWNNGEWGQGIYLLSSPLLSDHMLLHFSGQVVFSIQLLSSEPMSSYDPFRTRDDVSIYSLGLPYKVPQTRWLKLQKLTFVQFWRPEIWDQGVGRVVFFRFLSPWPVDGHVLPVFTRSLFCLFVLTSSSYKDTSYIGLGPTLMTSV